MCKWIWADEWLPAPDTTECPAGSECKKPNYNGTYTGQIGYTPCEIEET